MSSPTRLILSVVAVFTLLAAACGDDDDGREASASPQTTDVPTVVVTTNILGDVVENLAGKALNVVTIMPVGADAHDFQASAQQVATIGDAEVLIVNGAGFEEGLLDVIESAESDGVPVFEAISAVGTLEFAEETEHDEHDDDHDDEHEDEHAHEHDGDDPHFFTDPVRMAIAAEAITDYLMATVDGVDAEALRSNADAYIAELEALDAGVVETLEELSEDQRVLITNHEVFAYFADRYEFEVVGTVIPSGSTVDGTSAQDLAELAELIEAEGVQAIFSDASSSDELAQTLADEVGEVAVVELYTESLGEEGSDGATYLKMVQVNADRIATALGAE